MPPIER
ncbi:hypothetical protein YPPY91_1922, partial [Yersinia pestis PY-91]